MLLLHWINVIFVISFMLKETMLIRIFFFIFTMFCFLTCQSNQMTEDSDILVKLDDKVLLKSEVTALIPKGSTSADSMLLADSYVKKWLKEALVYDIAQKNLGDEMDNIEQLVENYRQSLVRYRYQEKLIKEKLSDEIRESDKMSYYEENPQKFSSDKNLIKGLFLKVPVDAPNVNKVREWYKSSSETSIENIEKYSVQYANIYEYFYDKWVDFDEIMDNIPEHVSNPVLFLKNNKSLEVKDSLFFYFLNIKQYLPVGSVEPYDYAEPEIKDILINQRKLEFLRNFENELYTDAIRKNRIVYYSR